MDSKDYDVSISDPEIHLATSIQSHKLLVDEVLQLLEKTKASLDVFHSIALQITDSTESSKVATMVEEKPVADEAIFCPNDQIDNEMLKIFVPTLFTEKHSANVADLL
ncbi:insulinase (Peptidase family M16) family protein [Striga asiatica]|uniref:Insulinase (Peptidase family M16) family protein n=1 Tax=Striga asiatica TaxID=4170 RepID=A0A5A7P3R8_STRAF|nr:insulinase (Peptidase family M16) family protein [Striga asiatica]